MLSMLLPHTFGLHYNMSSRACFLPTSFLAESFSRFILGSLLGSRRISHILPHFLRFCGTGPLDLTEHSCSRLFGSPFESLWKEGIKYFLFRMPLFCSGFYDFKSPSGTDLHLFSLFARSLLVSGSAGMCRMTPPPALPSVEFRFFCCNGFFFLGVVVALFPSTDVIFRFETVICRQSSPIFFLDFCGVPLFFIVFILRARGRNYSGLIINRQPAVFFPVGLTARKGSDLDDPFPSRYLRPRLLSLHPGFTLFFVS